MEENQINGGSIFIGIGERVLNGESGTTTVPTRGCNVERVTGGTIARDLGQGDAPRPGGRRCAFEHQECSRLTQQHTSPSRIERFTMPAGRERPQVGETSEVEAMQRVNASGKNEVGLAAANQIERLPDSIGARHTRIGDDRSWAVETQSAGNVIGDRVERRGQQVASVTRRVGQMLCVPALGMDDATEGGTQYEATAGRCASSEPGLGQRFSSSLLRHDKCTVLVWRRIRQGRLWHRSTNRRLMSRRPQLRDCLGAATSFDNGATEGIDPIAGSADNAESGDQTAAVLRFDCGGGHGVSSAREACHLRPSVK